MERKKTYLGAFGYTYFLHDGQLWACPTFKDGKLDAENELAVNDFAEPPTKEERAKIEYALRADPCAFCQDENDGYADIECAGCEEFNIWCDRCELPAPNSETFHCPNDCVDFQCSNACHDRHMRDVHDMRRLA